MTIRKTARFVVHPEDLDEAVVAIQSLIAHTRTEPGTRLYESWQSRTRLTDFLHLMEFVDEAAEQEHRGSDQATAFTERLYPLCVDPPHFDDWHKIET